MPFTKAGGAGVDEVVGRVENAAEEVVGKVVGEVEMESYSPVLAVET